MIPTATKHLTEQSSRPNWAQIVLAVLIVAAIAIGVHARFKSAGTADLAEDEYYTVVSVESVLEDGVPDFASGGYYTRGLLFQYPAAAAAWVLGADAFAYRLPAILFGLLAVGLTYVYARAFVPAVVAAAVAAAVLVSSWEIEFSRLIRFYTLFQCTTLLFLIAVERAFFRAAPGERYLPHLALVALALSHELSVLFVPLLFLPLWPGMTRLKLDDLAGWLRYGAVSLAVGLAVVASVRFNFRGVGVDPQMAGVRGDGARAGAIGEPVLPFWRVVDDPIVQMGLLVALFAVIAAVLLGLRLAGRRVAAPDLFLAGLVVACLANQLWLALAAAVVLFGRYHAELRANPGRAALGLGLACAIVLGYAAWGFLFPERIMTPATIADWCIEGTGLETRIKLLWSAFFGWPELYQSTVRPFLKVSPGVLLLVVLSLAWYLLTYLSGPLPDLFRHPGFVVIYFGGIFGLFTPDFDTTRYWFHLYPVMLVLIGVFVAELAGRLGRRFDTQPSTAAAVAGLAFLGLFALDPDFSPRHLGRVEAEEALYRFGPFASREDHWYARTEVRGVTALAEGADGPWADAPILVENTPQASYYLDEDHAVFLPRAGHRFATENRAGGTLHIWSDRLLLSTPEEVRDWAGDAERLILIRPAGTLIGHRNLDLAAVWPDREIDILRTETGRDGSAEVAFVELHDR
jgi:hypothetical protein